MFGTRFSSGPTLLGVIFMWNRPCSQLPGFFLRNSLSLSAALVLLNQGFACSGCIYQQTSLSSLGCLILHSRQIGKVAQSSSVSRLLFVEFSRCFLAGDSSCRLPCDCRLRMDKELRFAGSLVVALRPRAVVRASCMWI